MTRLLKPFLLILLLAAISSTLFAASAARPQTPAAVSNLLTRPLPPPADDSAETKAELALVLQVQSTRTEADIARAKSENSPSLDHYTQAVGPWFTAEKLPKTNALFRSLTSQAFAYVNAVKPDYRRHRPAVADPRIKPLFEETDSSYPSGHTISATLFSLVLCDLLPDLKTPILARAQEIGFDRIIAGMHYPSDIAAGRYAGQSLARALYTNPEFLNDLAAVRAEITAARPK